MVHPLLAVSVLGPLRLHIEDRAVTVRGALKNRLVSRLALTPNQAVSIDALIEAMWGDEPPRTARQSIHVHINHLRERLKPQGADVIVATTVDGRYQLGVDREAVDAWTFEHLVGEGRAALLAANPRRARDRLADAIEMWGEPFVDLADHAGAMAERHRLTALQESAVDTLGEALIDLGELDDAVPLLRSVVATAPLRERPYALLMNACLRSGEPAQSIEVYEHAAEVFDSALGVSPSAELSELAASARRPSRPGARAASAGRLDVDVSASWMLAVPDGVDVRPLMEAISDAAANQMRAMAHGRVTTGGNASPMSPVLELSGLAAPRRLGGDDDVRRLFAMTTHALVAKYSAAPVVVVEGIEHASDLLLDYLCFALDRPGPAPFTVILIDNGSVPDSRARARLATLCPVRDAPPLPATVPLADRLAPLDADELLVTTLVAAALKPVPTEVVVHASRLPAGRVAETIDRLVARNLVAIDAGGGLDLSTPFEAADVSPALTQRLPELHVALAEAFERGGKEGAGCGVAEARHRLAALPAGPADRAWAAGVAAARHLESLGAYREVLTLVESTLDSAEAWPEEPAALELLVLVGRAHIRCGASVEGRKVLERVISSTRSSGPPELFADAVRYLAEERAPQRSQDDVRDLVEEALAGLGDDPTDTRIQLMTDLANSHYLSDQREAERLGRSTLEAARTAPPAVRARAITGYIQALMRPGTAEYRRQLAIEAQQLARRSRSAESLVLALTYEAMALVELGDPARAEAPLRYAEALAAEVQVPRFQWWVAAWQALLGFVLGSTDDAEGDFRRAFEIWPTSTRSDPFECFASQITMLRLLDDRGADLLPVLEELAGPDADLAYLAPAALGFAQAGRVDTAIELVDRILDHESLDGRRDITMPFVLALVTEAAHRVGYDRVGSRLVELLEPVAAASVVLNIWGGGGFYWGSIEHAHGLALDLAGSRSDASAALRRAIRAHEEAGVQRFARRSRLALATIESA